MKGRRLFNGKAFDLRDERGNKRDAERLKKVLMDAGRKVRITHEQGMYQIWVR